MMKRPYVRVREVDDRTCVWNGVDTAQFHVESENHGQIVKRIASIRPNSLQDNISVILRLCTEALRALHTLCRYTYSAITEATRNADNETQTTIADQTRYSLFDGGIDVISTLRQDDDYELWKRRRDKHTRKINKGNNIITHLRIRLGLLKASQPRGLEVLRSSYQYMHIGINL